MNPNNLDIAVIKSEKIILDNIASDAGHHNAGALKIGPDKNYILPRATEEKIIKIPKIWPIFPEKFCA